MTTDEHEAAMGQFDRRRRVVVKTGSKPLGSLAERLSSTLGPVRVIGSVDVRVTEVAYDHRSIRRAGVAVGRSAERGAIFCCLPGEHADGHDFAAEARGNGAAAFICERDLGEAAAGATQIVVPPGAARSAMAVAACWFFDDPATRIRTFGVTGTNGKTTTTYLLASILEQAGYGTWTIGTLSGTRTTPEAPDLQRQLEAARLWGNHERKPAAVALEVTSHALAQHRVDGYVHDVVVFTNLSQDHLDYHGTMEAYFEAKASLFTPEHARVGVANAADPYGQRLLDEATIPMVPFSAEAAGHIELSATGTTLEIEGEAVELPLIGRFNVENALAAVAAAEAFGLGAGVIADGLRNAPQIPGRLERVGNPLGLTLVVDYAHTPDGLEKALGALRELASGRGRLIVVFGAGGDRDREKRPRMGHHASTLADVVVLTSDNPRHEEPESIIEQVRAGCDGGAELVVEVDRRSAIALALAQARAGDVVLVAGKGHETTQQVGDELIAFDDRTVVAEEAARLAGAV